MGQVKSSWIFNYNCRRRNYKKYRRNNILSDNGQWTVKTAERSETNKTGSSMNPRKDRYSNLSRDC